MNEKNKGLEEKIYDEPFNSFEFLKKIRFDNIWKDTYNDKGPVHAGFYVNCDKKLLVIVDHKLKIEKLRIHYNNEWTKIAPVVQFKHEMFFYLFAYLCLLLEFRLLIDVSQFYEFYSAV